MNDFILNNEGSVTDLGILKFLQKIDRKESIRFTTSGTTSVPKVVYHTYDSLIKNIKVRPNLKNAIWGLTYDYEKIAGSQVILQAYLNDSKIVNLYNKNNAHALIKQHKVSHLSGTATFYRLLTEDSVFNDVVQVTLGGETVDERLILKIKRAFPNASITNVYALTEFGTLFTSNTNYFDLSKLNPESIKIHDSRIFVNKDNVWIDTGDVIEMVDQNKFKIVGREVSMINVGGMKVNPIVVESALNQIDGVLNSRVYAKHNSVVGSVVTADVVLNKLINVSQIREILKHSLQKHEIPLKIKVVDSIETNSTGKINRS